MGSIELKLTCSFVVHRHSLSIEHLSFFTFVRSFVVVVVVVVWSFFRPPYLVSKHQAARIRQTPLKLPRTPVEPLNLVKPLCPQTPQTPHLTALCSLHSIQSLHLRPQRHHHQPHHAPPSPPLTNIPTNGSSSVIPDRRVRICKK